mgnify:FL=1|tara:strand:+ start:45 stop:530 length:486 start_codon:yes stop_codon:yes gene_type:complete
MKWYLKDINPHIYDIKKLFEKTKGHKHESNYVKWPLFEHTKFARMGYDFEYHWKNQQKWNLVYYSAGIERPEYNGGIRIMSRHTRDRNHNWGSMKDDLQRGNATLEQSTKYALELGYKDIWVSREENPKLLEWFQEHNSYNWKLTQEEIPRGGLQWVLRLA